MFLNFLDKPLYHLLKRAAFCFFSNICTFYMLAALTGGSYKRLKIRRNVQSLPTVGNALVLYKDVLHLLYIFGNVL